MRGGFRVASFFRTLQWKTFLPLAIATMALLGGYALLQQRQLSAKLLENAVSQAAMVADTIHLGLVQNMITNNREGIERSLSDLLNNPSIKEIHILDTNGKVLFTSNPLVRGSAVEGFPGTDPREGKRWKVVDSSEGGSDLYRLNPIPNRKACHDCHMEGREYLGSIALRLSLYEGEDILRQSRLSVALLAALALLLLFAVNYFAFSAQVVKPLRNFALRLGRVGKGEEELDGADQGGVEIAALQRACQHMVSLLDKTHTRRREREKDLVLMQQDRAHQAELEELGRQLTNRIAELDEANLSNKRMAFELEKKNISLQRAVKNISALNRVGVALSSELDIDRLVKLLLSISVKGLRSEIGYIMIIDEGTKQLEIKAWEGLGEEFAPEEKVEWGDSVSGLVAKTGKPLLIKKVEEGGEINPESRFGFTRRTVVSAPIKMKDRLLGVIELTNKRGGEGFNEEDLEMMQSIANQAAVALENANLYKEIQQSYFDTVRALIQAVEEKDKYTRGHSERVTTFSCKIAEKVGLDEKKTQLIRYAGVLHDVGKIGIDVNIIQKAGRLTAEEFNLVKSHPVIGERIIRPVQFLKDVLPIVIQHHEKYDGSGYPLGLEASHIVQEARILAVADAYDAMITARPYRNPLPKREAVAELKRCSGTQFDPVVVEAFLEILEEDQEVKELEESLSKVGT